ncbi:MAG: type IV secretion system DNA-binding domain-containing protein [Patescibacteria group bacterium]|nr:type IV secretion system DNA-binding domain-containing protein [Patescibacteria group bacterium]
MSVTLIVAIAAVALVGGALLAIRKARQGMKEPIYKGKVLVIKVPKENEKGALSAEQMFASLHGLLRLTPGIQEHISFEIAASSAGIYFYTWVPEHLTDFVKSQIFAQYPNAEIEEADDYTEELDDLGKSLSGAKIELAKSHIFSIKTFPDFDVDPLAAITGALSEVGEEDQVWIQILLRPIPDVWQQEGYDYIDAVRSGVGGPALSLGEISEGVMNGVISILTDIPTMIFYPGREVEVEEGGGVQLTPSQQTEIQAVEEKMSRVGFETAIRLIAIGSTPEKSESLLRSASASFKQFSTANLNSFTRSSVGGNPDEFLENYRTRKFPEDWVYILNTGELASVFHLPNVSVETPSLAWSRYKKGEPPLDLPIAGEDVTYLGLTTFRDRMVRFGIKREDRPRHIYSIGKTGVGKTTLFENMAIQDMRAGEGVAFIDPHGESIDRLLDFVPEERIDDVVLFNPADKEFPLGFNMLELQDPDQKSLIASGLIDVFRKRFSFSWGPRLEHILRNCVLTLLEVPRTTLLGVTRLLQDKNYRNYIVYKIDDPIVKRFWEDEFKGMLSNNRLVTEAIAPIQNRLGQFLASPTIRNIVGQPHSSFDLTKIMNERKIFLVNLSKGKLGVDDSEILGSMLVSRMQFEAMRRVNIPEESRPNFYLYVDEFQNFASGSFASILSEARKYHLCLNITHQYVAQLPEEMQDAVFGNVGTIISFALGAPDAKVLAEEFTPVFTEEDLISLEKYHVYLELMIDGMTSPPFSAVTFPLNEEYRTGNRNTIIERSREKYARGKSAVSEAIAKWNGTQFDLGMAKAEDARQREKEED